MGALLKIELEAEWVTCCSCGVQFASPIFEYRRKDGKEFYCPNGHSLSWNASIKRETEKLREQLAARERQLTEERSARWTAC